MVPVTVFVAGSILDTVSSPEFETHTAPAPTATSSGTAPTGIVASTLFVAGSILLTEPERAFTSAFTTHRSPAPVAIPMGSSPTVTVARTSTGGGPEGVGVALADAGGTRSPPQAAASIASASAAETA